MGQMDQGIESAIHELVTSGLAKAGDPVVVVTGTIQQKGATNLMRVHYA
jgi:pyruvate kinase